MTKCVTFTEEESKSSPAVQRKIEELTETFTQAGEGLKTIDKKSIQELKALPSPPPAVVSALGIVCALLDRKDLGWRSSMKAMANPN